MQKALLIIGKALIICGPLFPVPLGWILYPWFGYKIDMPMWGIKVGYWTPMFYVMGFGLLLCFISRYKAKQNNELDNAPLYKSTITAYLHFLICGGLAIVGGFMLLTLLIVGFWYLFLTERILITIPILLGIFLLWFGAGYYYKHRDKDNV